MLSTGTVSVQEGENLGRNTKEVSLDPIEFQMVRNQNHKIKKLVVFGEGVLDFKKNE